jgi:hypothetical protein
MSGKAGLRLASYKAPYLTSTVNLISLQKDLKLILKGPFEFRNTRAGNKVMSKEMTDYSAIRHNLDSKQLCYFTFFLKSGKPIKFVLRYLLADTPAEDISNASLIKALTS